MCCEDTRNEVNIEFVKSLYSMGLYHPLDGDTNLKYKLLCFLTPNKKNSMRKALTLNWDRCCHIALCLWLILFHYPGHGEIKPFICHVTGRDYCEARAGG